MQNVEQSNSGKTLYLETSSEDSTVEKINICRNSTI